jgi:tRNA A-37 threonylcarbamoyl transferase component Bud32
MRVESIRTTVDRRREIKRCPSCGQRFSREAAFCPFDGVKLEDSLFDPSGDALVGQVVDGRYEVIGVVGEGGMGRVYEVRHAALERTFAMKVLRRELAREEDLAERFIREAKATASVKHPNVVQITDFGRLPDGIPYFVMELLVGQTLAEIIKAHGPVPAARAVRILRKVAGAVGAAHEAGVVHRDLKPENVFLVDGGRSLAASGADVRVVDFGAAKIVGSSRMTRSGVVFGTPHYMSPEQASGQSVDHRSDVYALGVIMYEMFTGRVPFEADTYMGVLTQHMFVQPERPSHLNGAARDLGALEDITLVCLAKKPEDRFASMAALVDAIDGATRARPDAAPDSSTSVAPPPPASAQVPPIDPRATGAGPTIDEARAAIHGLAAAPSLWLLWGAVGVAALLVGVLALRLFWHREAAPAMPVVAAQATAAAPPVASIAAPLPAETASGGGAAVTPSGGPPVSPPVHRTVHVREGSGGPRVPIDDVGDPFAEKR